MARKRANLITRADRWVSNDLALLELNEYQPFLTVRDVPSLGRCHRIKSTTVGRVHHLFSDLEARCFLMVDYAYWIIDIREQYPLLPLQETREIAALLGVKHPAYHGIDNVMSTDLLLTTETNQLLPIYIKPSKKLNNRRILEKLEIEKVYWRRRGLGLKIITEREINRKKVNAIRWARRYMDLEGVKTGNVPVSMLMPELEGHLKNHPYLPVAELCHGFDSMAGFSRGASLSLVRHAIANQYWTVNLQNGINTMEPLVWQDAA